MLDRIGKSFELLDYVTDNRSMPVARISRPYVILNAAMSLDGKIATYTGDSKMSSPSDVRRVHRLRASVDGIMVGVRTLLRDDPKLTVKYARDRRPYRIIVDSNAQTPLTSYVVKSAGETLTIVAVTSRAPRERVENLAKKGVRVIVCGNGRLVSVRILMRVLRRLGLRKILLEGGGALNWSMLGSGLVDEISVAVTPRILGGVKAVSLVTGKGFGLVKDAVKLRLLSAAKYGPDLVVRYKVEY